MLSPNRLATQLVNRWQNQRFQLDEKIEAIAWPVSSAAGSRPIATTDVQRHELKSELNAHFRTEVELLKTLEALRGGKPVELQACQRQIHREHQHLTTQMQHCILDSEWELPQDDLGNDIGLDVFAENWDQHGERVRLAIDSFFPAATEFQLQETVS